MGMVEPNRIFLYSPQCFNQTFFESIQNPQRVNFQHYTNRIIERRDYELNNFVTPDHLYLYKEIYLFLLFFLLTIIIIVGGSLFILGLRYYRRFNKTEENWNYYNNWRKKRKKTNASADYWNKLDFDDNTGFAINIWLIFKYVVASVLLSCFLVLIYAIFRTSPAILINFIYSLKILIKAFEKKNPPDGSLFYWWKENSFNCQEIKNKNNIRDFRYDLHQNIFTAGTWLKQRRPKHIEDPKKWRQIYKNETLSRFDLKTRQQFNKAKMKRYETYLELKGTAIYEHRKVFIRFLELQFSVHRLFKRWIRDPLVSLYPFEKTKNFFNYLGRRRVVFAPDRPFDVLFTGKNIGKRWTSIYDKHHFLNSRIELFNRGGEEKNHYDYCRPALSMQLTVELGLDHTEHFLYRRQMCERLFQRKHILNYDKFKEFTKVHGWPMLRGNRRGVRSRAWPSYLYFRRHHRFFTRDHYYFRFNNIYPAKWVAKKRWRVWLSHTMNDDLLSGVATSRQQMDKELNLIRRSDVHYANTFKRHKLYPKEERYANLENGFSFKNPSTTNILHTSFFIKNPKIKTYVHKYLTETGCNNYTALIKGSPKYNRKEFWQSIERIKLFRHLGIDDEQRKLAKKYQIEAVFLKHEKKMEQLKLELEEQKDFELRLKIKRTINKVLPRFLKIDVDTEIMARIYRRGNKPKVSEKLIKQTQREHEMKVRREGLVREPKVVITKLQQMKIYLNHSQKVVQKYYYKMFGPSGLGPNSELRKAKIRDFKNKY
jgi:hypothetical protein